MVTFLAVLGSLFLIGVTCLLILLGYFLFQLRKADT